MSRSKRHRHPGNAPGEWFIDTACIDCGASANVAPGLIARRGGQSVFARQPADAEEERAAWRARLVCPTASVATVGVQAQPEGLYPDELAAGIYRCGYNSRKSFGAHSYFAARDTGNLLIDSPRYLRRLVDFFAARGGIADVLLTHQDDVADADRYAARFGARVWIHEHDAAAAPFATELLRGREPVAIRPDLVALPVPGHTRGSVCYRLEAQYLFTGDSLAWSFPDEDLTAFRGACWYSWPEQKKSLARLEHFAFTWVLAGHGGSIRRPREEMRQRLRALVARM
jgi:glyoxylase-like metal-dependent hydrolase (beta-lactamase superfamily II)